MKWFKKEPSKRAVCWHVAFVYSNNKVKLVFQLKLAKLCQIIDFFNPNIILIWFNHGIEKSWISDF